MTAQLIHAAGESSPGNLPDNTFAVCLAVPDEAALLKLEEKLLLAEIPHKAIREPDAPYLGAMTAIGVCPIDRVLVKKFLANYPLLK